MGIKIFFADSFEATIRRDFQELLILKHMLNNTLKYLNIFRIFDKIMQGNNDKAIKIMLAAVSNGCFVTYYVIIFVLQCCAKLKHKLFLCRIIKQT